MCDAWANGLVVWMHKTFPINSKCPTNTSSIVNNFPKLISNMFQWRLPLQTKRNSFYHYRRNSQIMQRDFQCLRCDMHIRHELDSELNIICLWSNIGFCLYRPLQQGRGFQWKPFTDRITHLDSIFTHEKWILSVSYLSIQYDKSISFF